MKEVIVNEKNKKVLKYLEKRNLVKQYQKAKDLIFKGEGHKVNLKKREPKIYNVYSFRINNQYRAIGTFQKGRLVIFEINDHQ